MIPALASIVDISLDEALSLVDQAFDAQKIAARSIDSAGVVEYYRQSARAYRMFHSGEGALHIGLRQQEDASDQHDVGHQRHWDLFADQIVAIDAQRCIEFGCGMGYNVSHLALVYPHVSFTGVDLSPQHIRYAQQQAGSLMNLQVVEANYQSLDFDDSSFDAVLAVETLCQTDDQRLALAEAYRLLRPGGRMLVIDCFRNAPLESLDDNLKTAARLVEKTAAVDAFAVVDDWKQLVCELGFELQSVTDHSAETATDLSRLYRLSRRFFKMSQAVKLIRRTMPALAMENAVCGLLMPFTVGLGAHGYYSIVLEKPATSISNSN